MISDAAKGSPPQVRGKPAGVYKKVRNAWITPAGAGKTRRCIRVIRHYEDHPRRCGENRHFDSGFAVKIGSPPQVRGKLERLILDAEALGITPAGAGKTSR